MPSTDDRDLTRPLDGRKAIVTGGGSGIGQAIALLFARRGARVTVLDLSAESTIQRIVNDGGVAMHIECDVSQREAVDAAFENEVGVRTARYSRQQRRRGARRHRPRDDLGDGTSVVLLGEREEARPNSLRAGVNAHEGSRWL